jgi:hypothetical protein
MLQKTPFKKSFLWKSQNVQKRPIMVESFVDIGSFDYDCTQIFPIFYIHVFRTSFQTCGMKLNFFYKKMIVFINVTNWIKNQDFKINFNKFDVYNIKNLCHHVQNILFHLRLIYKSIWTNISIFVDSLNWLNRKMKHGFGAMF